MKKFYLLQKYLLKEINRYEALTEERDIEADWERIHISSCAKLGYILAEERGVDPELSACACAIHDYGRIITGKQKGHAEAGYEPVKKFLKNTKLFSDEEIEQMANSLRNHSSKGRIDCELDEIVKDADILDFYQYGHVEMREDQKNRLAKLSGNTKRL